MVRTGRPKAELRLIEDERAELLGWLQASTSTTAGASALALRAQIVLTCAEGLSSKAVAAQLGITEATVGKWRRRFIADRLEGLLDGPRQGRPATIGLDQVRNVVVATLEPAPAGAPNWSRALMAQHSGLSKSTVGRIWKLFELQPHRAEGLTPFSAALFIEKVCHLVGLYLDPPESAFVYCLDETSLVNRPRPVNHQPSGDGDGVFAKIDLTPDAVALAINRLGRPAEFQNFLTTLDAQVPPQFDVHLVCDTYGTHGHPAIAAWRSGHSRFRLHFIPTGSSWAAQVEQRFTVIADELIRRGDGASADALEAAIAEWAADWDESRAPFFWSQTTDRILRSFG